MQINAAASFNNGQIPIQYNDQIVNLNPNSNLNLKWLNIGVKNGLKTLLFGKNKMKLNLALPKSQFKMLNNEWKNERKPPKIQPSYIHYTGIEEISNHDLEYDLDKEDIEWLRLINPKRLKLGFCSIKENDLEKAIDFLEKESHFQYSIISQPNNLLPMIDNDAPCCVCNDMEDTNANQIIFCDMCNIAVHQECYGVPYIPEGQWLCRRCQLSPSVTVKCELCPFTTGAFKQTSDGRWAHVLCAIWLNEVHFANTIFLEPIEGVNHSIKRRHKLTCKICKRKTGACLQCSNRCCSRPFHVTCGFYAGVKMEVKETRSKKEPEAVTVNRFAYCLQHSQAEAKSEETPAAKNREIKRKMQEARKRLANEKKEIKCSVPVPVIPGKKIEEISKQLKIDNFADIISYWSMKRESRCGVPLIRRLQVYFGQQKPMISRHSMGAISTSRPCSSTNTSWQSPADQSNTVVKLRQTFERARLICEMVLKREKIKLEALEFNEVILTKIKPISLLMKETLEKLIQKDYDNVFTKPVNEIEVPGYYEIIKKPMDLQKMFNNFEGGKYKRIADIRVDFNLMMQNCIYFNRNNQYYYKYGQRIKRIGLGVIKNAEDEEAKFTQNLPMIKQLTGQLNLSRNTPIVNSFDSELNFHAEVDAPSFKDVQEDKSTQPRKKTGSTKSANISIKRERTSSNSNSIRKVEENQKEELRQTIEFETMTNQLSNSVSTSRKESSSNKSTIFKEEVTKSKSIPKRSSINSFNFPRCSLQLQQSYEMCAPDSKRAKNKYVNQRERRSFCRGVEKMSYANAYLTETSSTADESDSAFLDVGTFSPSIEEDAANDELPAIEEDLPHSNEKKSQKVMRRFNNESFMETINQFDHNDIVLAHLNGNQIPARVIDLRMRFAIDELGSQFFNSSIAKKPVNGQNTLVILFDTHNTAMWIPNHNLEHLSIAKVSPHSNQTVNFAEALNKARQFCKNMDLHQF